MWAFGSLHGETLKIVTTESVLKIQLNDFLIVIL